MVSYTCKNCGGQMELSSSGGFVCTSCGSKAFFTDADFKGNEKFRQALLQYYKAEAENKENDYSADRLWVQNGTDSFEMTNGKMLNIEYMKKYSYSGAACYLARKNVIYVFDKKHDADDFLSGIKRLSFPPADSKLSRSFPEINLIIDLKGDRRALAFKRRPNFYPAELFAPWQPEHLAWVISRMENICCALAYSDREHGNIGPDSIWINPATHEGVLFGDWRNTQALRGTADLKAVRKAAVALASDIRTPVQLYRFLMSAPEADAFSDFEKWDRVIVEGFGGHKFIKM